VARAAPASTARAGPAGGRSATSVQSGRVGNHILSVRRGPVASSTRPVLSSTNPPNAGEGAGGSSQPSAGDKIAAAPPKLPPATCWSVARLRRAQGAGWRRCHSRRRPRGVRKSAGASRNIHLARSRIQGAMDRPTIEHSHWRGHGNG
jgi:hypothetical protein